FFCRSGVLFAAVRPLEYREACQDRLKDVGARRETGRDVVDCDGIQGVAVDRGDEAPRPGRIALAPAVLQADAGSPVKLCGVQVPDQLKSWLFLPLALPSRDDVPCG